MKALVSHPIIQSTHQAADYRRVCVLRRLCVGNQSSGMSWGMRYSAVVLGASTSKLCAVL